MTFEQWQATKKLVGIDDEAVDSYPFAEDTTQVWIYAGGLFIECRPQGGYLLPLPMVEYEGEEIEPMERRLYEFGLMEGNIEREP
jgi:hypothetical protein